ncbi:MAG: hypothetical protein LH478_01695 [Chitinophagaceae bacterium]|nr:hypothetical protein [Chitinophagaceae bacterium]
MNNIHIEPVTISELNDPLINELYSNLPGEGDEPRKTPEIEPEKLPKEDPGIQPDTKPKKEDDDDDDDDDYEPYTEPEIGDDPDREKNKIPIM